MPRLLPPVIAPGTVCAQLQPTLSGKGLVLRPWQAADAPAVLTAYQDPDIQHWHGRSMLDVAEAVDWIGQVQAGWEQERLGGWAVEADGTVVGRAVLRFSDLYDGIGEVGYWVLPGARRRNVATRAVQALSRWALTDLGLHRLELEHSAANAASCRVALKAGFEPEGTRRAALRHTDGWHDMHVHALVAVVPRIAGALDGG